MKQTEGIGGEGKLRGKNSAPRKNGKGEINLEREGIGQERLVQSATTGAKKTRNRPEKKKTTIKEGQTTHDEVRTHVQAKTKSSHSEKRRTLGPPEGRMEQELVRFTKS